MNAMPDTVKIAVVQGAPLPFDLDGTVEKVVALTREAGENGAKLVVFPEAFIAGYPDWVWLIPNSKGAAPKISCIDRSALLRLSLNMESGSDKTFQSDS